MSDRVEASYSLLEEPQAVVPSNAASEDSLICEDVDTMDIKAVWENVIDQKLIEWGRDPSQLEEDELIPPTRVAVDQAVRIAQEAISGSWSPPMSVIPDGDGGIAFERWSGSLTESIEVARDGRIEYVVCRDRKVVIRVESSLRPK